MDRRLLLVACTSLLVGGALGALLVSVLSVPPPLPAPAVVPAIEAAEPDAPVAARPVAAPPPARTPDSRPPPVTTSRPGSIREDDLPRFERLVGTGTISGSVRGPGGTPVPGVRIVASPEAPEELRAPWVNGVEPPLLERVASHAAVQSFVHSNRIEAITAAAGDYEFLALPDLVYRLRASANGFEVQPTNRVYRVTPDARIDFTADPIIRLELSPQLADGSTPDRMMFSTLTTAGKGIGRGTWTPDRPSFDLPPGVYTLRAWVTEPEPQSAEGITVSLRAGQVQPPLEVRLQVAPALRGQLVITDDPAEEYEIYLLPYSGSETPSTRSVKNSQLRERARPAGQFEYAFPDLAPGGYFLAAFIVGSTEPVASALVEIGAGILDFDLVVPPDRPEDYVIVQVLDPAGATAVDVSVYSRLSYAWGHAGGNHGRTREDGTFKVLHLVPATLERPVPGDGLVDQLVVQSDVYGTQTFDYERSSAQVTVQLTAPALVTVIIPGFAGSGLEDRLEARMSRSAKNTSQGFRLRHQEGEPPGSFRSSPAPPGRFDFQLTLGDRVLLAREVELVGGDNRIELPIPRLHRLEIIGTSPEHGHLQLQLIVDGDTGHARFALNGRRDDDGSCVFEHLPAGHYRLIAGRQQDQMQFDLRGDMQLVFTPDPDDALIARVAGAGYLQDLGLSPGDALVGIDGVPSADPAALRATLLDAACAGSAVRLSLLREGQTLEVEADARRLLLSEGAGGSFRSGRR